jgi:neutral ceramidase
MIGGFLSVPTKEQIECQHPKPILLNTGNAKLPYRWDPAVIPISVFRVGQLFILSVPGEFTTMAGRRLRRAIRSLLVKHDIKVPVVTIAGLTNSYTHYVTTIEEYAGQRYEAASTLYGPHTLSAYIQEFERITKNLLDGTPSTTNKEPDDLSSKQLSLLPPVEFDTIGIGRKVSYSFFHSFFHGIIDRALLTIFCHLSSGPLPSMHWISIHPESIPSKYRFILQILATTKE